MDDMEAIWQEQEAEEAAKMAQQELADSLQIFGARLKRLADDQVKAKTDIEARWLEDLRAYHGRYNEGELARIRKINGSEIFVNITRHKCNTAESRLIDMLFPPDDKNWSISATPSPQLENMPVDADIKTIVQQGNRAAKDMEREIHDQLVEANYSAKCRDAIHDAVIFGTGIIKAPVVEGRVNKRWTRGEDGSMRLVVEEVLAPTVEVVSPWDYFPDMSARNKSECEFEFERKFLNKRQVKDLMLLPNVLVDQVAEILRDEDAEITQNDRFSEVREISGDTVNNQRTRYEMWEYHGSITNDELAAVGIDAEEGAVVFGTVLLLNGRVIRVSLNPLDTEESPYSLFNWEVDANGMFGFGVPYLVRSPQRMVNASVRMMMDNAKLSVAPQIMLNKKLVEPADGDWSFAPFKRWYIKDETVPINQAMQFFNVPSNQADLSAIYQLSRFLVDEQSSLPAVATGEGDPNAAPQTATGVAIQSGAAKVVFKRVVKNFDDDLTIPTIKRFYDWNMQYSDKDEIKGDFEVHAKGTSTLMVKEQEAALMAEVLGMIDPMELRLRIKPEEAIKEFFKLRGINAADMLRSDEEVAEQMQKMQEQQQGAGDQDAQKLQMQMQIEQAKLQQKEMQLQMDMQQWQTEAQQKEQQMVMQYELEMSKLAAQQQTTVEKLKLESGALETKVMLDQMREQNRREVEQQRIETQRQIAAIRAQQTENRQAMQLANLKAGYDTFG